MCSILARNPRLITPRIPPPSKASILRGPVRESTSATADMGCVLSWKKGGEAGWIQGQDPTAKRPTADRLTQRTRRRNRLRSRADREVRRRRQDPTGSGQRWKNGTGSSPKREIETGCTG